MSERDAFYWGVVLAFILGANLGFDLAVFLVLKSVERHLGYKVVRVNGRLKFEKIEVSNG